MYSHTPERIHERPIPLQGTLPPNVADLSSSVIECRPAHEFQVRRQVFCGRDREQAEIYAPHALVPLRFVWWLEVVGEVFEEGDRGPSPTQAGVGVMWL
jgi:hypothetical protein